MTTKQKQVMQAYIATGRLAFYRPRKNEISLNGHKAVSVKEAVAKMEDCLRRGA